MCFYLGRNRRPRRPARAKVNPSSNSLDVRWDDAKGDNVEGYRLNVGTPSNPRQFSQRYPRDTTSATVPGLDPDTDYQVQIVTNAAGRESEPLTKPARTSKFIYACCLEYIPKASINPEDIRPCMANDQFIQGC